MRQEITAHLAKLEQGDRDELLVSSHHDGTDGHSGCGQALQWEKGFLYPM